MFEKIFQKLKDARAENSAVSDRTLETQARTLETIITTDEALALYNAKTAVESLEGNIRFTASEAVKKSQADTEKANKEKAEKEAKDKADKEKAKKAAGGKEPDPLILALQEQNKLLMENLNAVNSKVEGMQKNTIASTREQQLTKVLDGVPEYLANPIKSSFKIATFEDEDAFTSYLSGVTTETNSFKEAAKKQGLNTFSPSKEVKVPEPSGQTPQLQKARELINKQKEKENATNRNK